MPLYNPYRNYDKGMDDSYMGKEPEMTDSQQYMEGYEYQQELEEIENTQINENTHNISSITYCSFFQRTG